MVGQRGAGGAVSHATGGRTAALVVLAATAVSLLAFDFVVRRLSFISVGLAAYDEVQSQLRHSLDDQKTLARFDPAHADQYHRRFDATAALLGHLRVVQVSRRELAGTIEKVLLATVAMILLSGGALYYTDRRGRERRLVRLERAVEALSRGEVEITLGERRNDVISRIATAVERSSRAAAQDRRRLRYLEHLSAWQEAARRHAHEIRTPLAAARMEVDRFAGDMRRRFPEAAGEIAKAHESIVEEMDSLRDFTRSFTSFATIPPPNPRPRDLTRLLDDFCATFADAWPNARLVFAGRGESVMVNADGEMIRRVLVNLASNSALAFGDRSGTIELRLAADGTTCRVDVADDGPGIDPAIRPRLFEPYTTTRGIGEGMGLGLAISKKIMLDHGGDLDLIDSESGTAFRLTFPRMSAAS